MYLLSSLSVQCVCVDASVYHLQVWDKKKDSNDASFQLSLCLPLPLPFPVPPSLSHRNTTRVLLFNYYYNISFVHSYIHDLLVNVEPTNGAMYSQLGLDKLFFFSNLLFYSFMLVLLPIILLVKPIILFHIPIILTR